MTKKFVLTILVLLFALCIANTSNAALFDRGGGLIYDDLLDITWLQYANYSGQTMTWDDATDWVENLDYHGYDDWRLPASDTTCSGSDCINSEMGHLFYTEGVSSDSPGLFTDVKPSMYWSSTESSGNASQAWRFSFKYGTQGESVKTLSRYAWAVRDGDSAPPVVPEPISSALFITGGVTLGIRRFLGKQTD